MGSTECPYCHKIMYNHGSIFSKCIGSPLTTCARCGKTIVDNNMYEWGANPLESRLYYCFFANYRGAFHWFAFWFCMSGTSEGLAWGIFALILIESLFCLLSYFFVTSLNSNEIQKSLKRIENIEYIGQLYGAGYDKLDLKLYNNYLKRKSNSSSKQPNRSDDSIPNDSVSSDQFFTSSSSFECDDPKPHIDDTQSCQQAFERWKNRKKSEWDIGIEYERYIGYLLECEGYKVSYVGATQGLNDRGRDLIATKKKKGLVIQCKRWSTDKTIHEKHIHQLHGSTSVLSIQNPEITYKGVFITTTELSPEAKKDAALCNIEVIEQFPMAEYPLIKCNSNMKGQKIYHLPFDPQYDVIIISKNNESCYAWTIEDAESMGFRHSYQRKIKEVHMPKHRTGHKETHRKQKSSFSYEDRRRSSNRPKSAAGSSLIQNMEYKNNSLYLTLTNGSTYCYYNVPEYVYREMLAAPSKGRFYHERIRDRYPYY